MLLGTLLPGRAVPPPAQHSVQEDAARVTAGRQRTHKICSMAPHATTAAAMLNAASATVPRGEGHDALLHGLGEVGDVAPTHMPWLLRLAHVRSAILMLDC